MLYHANLCFLGSLHQATQNVDSASRSIQLVSIEKVVRDLLARVVQHSQGTSDTSLSVAVYRQMARSDVVEYVVVLPEIGARTQYDV